MTHRPPRGQKYSLWIALLLGITGVFACSAPSMTGPAGTPDATPPPPPGPTQPPPSLLPHPFGDIQLWSHPNQLMSHLISHPTAWAEVAQSVEVFGMFVGAVNSQAAPVGAFTADLAPLAMTGRAVALEVGGLRPFACTGLQSANGDEKAIRQVEAAGFTVLYLRMDNPFTFVLKDAFHDNPCQHSIASAVDELIVYMQTVSARHPGLAIHFGWDEAAYLHQWPGFAPSAPGFDGGDFKEMISQLLTRSRQAGVPVEYFHLDGSLDTHLAYEWNHRGDPWARLAALAAHVRSLGTRFGVLLNFQQPCVGGCATHQSGATAAEFVQRTLTYYDCLAEHNIDLDDVVPESWWNEPSQFFPLEDSSTFGHLTMALAARIADPSLIRPCPGAEFTGGKWVFSDQ